MKKLLGISLLLLAATSLRAAGPLDNTIGPIQGREGPPYIEASAEADMKYFQQGKISIFHKLTNALAEKSEMNMRVVKMKANEKMCQVAKTKQPSMKALAEVFKGFDRIRFTVKKNGA